MNFPFQNYIIKNNYFNPIFNLKKQKKKVILTVDVIWHAKLFFFFFQIHVTR